MEDVQRRAKKREERGEGKETDERDMQPGSHDTKYASKTSQASRVPPGLGRGWPQVLTIPKDDIALGVGVDPSRAGINTEKIARLKSQSWTPKPTPGHCADPWTPSLPARPIDPGGDEVVSPDLLLRNGGCWLYVFKLRTRSGFPGFGGVQLVPRVATYQRN